MATTIKNETSGVTFTFTYDMIFEDELLFSPIVSEVTRTLGGGVLVQEYDTGTEVGRNITLAAQDALGYQKKSVVELLKIESEKITDEFTLTISHNALTFTRKVRFRNEIEGGAVQMTPIFTQNGLPVADTYCSGKIYLQVTEDP